MSILLVLTQRLKLDPRFSCVCVLLLSCYHNAKLQDMFSVPLSPLNSSACDPSSGAKKTGKMSRVLICTL